MAIMLGITKKGIKDICLIAVGTDEGKELVALYLDLEPEILAFEDVINEKLRTQGNTEDDCRTSL